MRSKLIVLLTVITLLIVSAVPSFATGSSSMETRVEHFPDGSYAIITIEEEPNITPFATAKSKTVQTTYEYYNVQGKHAWDFILKGTFSYDQKTAKATAASTSYKIYVDGWKCTSRDSWTTGATAKGTGTFKYLTMTKNVELGLKCSPSGTVTAV
ncbi:Uncharacterised protein [uncultured Eubacterium sp.]|uniref:hypothetical protein n=1 Tax=Emergencia sp. TaxID=1926557 RepID=UPI0008207E74|nr:Uncharacterised protein [uncultured Eubacterium sp.]